jgi:phosphatidylglycerol---prolipoprotein diacylglyceryl transferase
MNLVAGIAFPTFPVIEIGPFSIMTFGVFVALGVIVGIWVAARRNERFGIARGETERVGIILVLVGFLGARLLWVFTHLGEINSPLDVIAVWDGGLQFSGGFITAIVVAPFITRRWPKEQRWNLLDGAVLGLAVGQAIGRLGCVAVGEHLGAPTDFFLGWTYTGGVVVEGPLEVGVTYHNAALYEFLWLIPVIILLVVLDRRHVPPGIMTGTFAIAYGVLRFLTDFLRINDRTLFGLTGAQYMTIALVAFGIIVIVLALKRFRLASTEGTGVDSVEGNAPDSGDSAMADLGERATPDDSAASEMRGDPDDRS